MIGKRYGAEYKIGKVREYLKEADANPKLTKADFAYRNGISDSTFNDWVLKYQRMGDGFANVTGQIELLSGAVEAMPAMVRYDGEVHGELPKDMVRVIYHGITVEFNEALAERVMGIIRAW